MYWCWLRSHNTKRLQNSFNLYLANVAFYDVILALVDMPTLVHYSLCGKWALESIYCGLFIWNSCFPMLHMMFLPFFVFDRLFFNLNEMQCMVNAWAQSSYGITLQIITYILPLGVNSISTSWLFGNYVSVELPQARNLIDRVQPITSASHTVRGEFMQSWQKCC